MKRFLLSVAVVAMVLPGCQKINDALDELDGRLDKLEQEAIPTIDEQIAAINLSLTSLGAMDKELKGYIDNLTATASNLQEQINNTNTKIGEVKAALQGEISTAKAEVLAQLDAVKTELEGELAQINTAIATLQAKDAELEGKIAELKTYVDTELKSTTDWANATFATLEQLDALSKEVALVKAFVDANKTEATANLATAISNLESSMKSWVGEQLAGYYTIAEVDAKITVLQNAMTTSDTALQQELNTLKNQLTTTASEITAAYKKAIEEAINTNNGVINTKIANEIATVNTRINNEVLTINQRISEIEKRLADVEDKVNSIEQQISAINTSIDTLTAMDKELKAYIDGLTATASNLQEQINSTNTKIDEVKATLQGEISTAKAEVVAQLEALETEMEAELAQINAAITTLQAKDKEIENKIATLNTYVNNELGKTTDWVAATFATLEQYNALVSEVATIKVQITATSQSVADLETRLTTKINEDIATAVSNLSADIQQKVSEITTAYTNAVKTAKEEITAAYATAIQTALNALDASLKAWVGKQLANYYTIAEVEAKISALQIVIAENNTALQEELNRQKNNVESAKSEITAAYKKAIEEAITTNNGVIDTKIANEIATVNNRIDSKVATINANIANIETRLDNVEAKIAELLARIQSVSYIPTYSDGKATVKYAEDISQVTLDFEVSPKDAVAELAKVWVNAVSVKAVYTQTRAVSFVDMPIVKFEADAVNGIISVIASGENLSAEFFAGMQEASCRLAISDGNNSVTSEYISMVAKSVSADELVVVMPNNEIWYKSSSGQIPFECVWFYGEDLTTKEIFGANIISHTYGGGKGVLTFDGPVTKLGSRSFDYPYGGEDHPLLGISLPNTITSVEKGTFQGCQNLVGFYGDLASDDNMCLVVDGVLCACANSDEEINSYTIPNSVITINPYVFHPNIKSITLHNNVKSISLFPQVFSCDTSLDIIIQDLSAWCNMQFIGGSTGGLDLNGGTILLNGEPLKNITIPNTLTTINDYIFSSCSDLTTVTMGNNILSIGQCAFYSCKSLTSVTIGNSVTLIEYNAFRYCRSLTSITIPDSVTSIGYGAFFGCSSLTSVYCKATTPPYGGSSMFANNASGRKIYVPRNSVSAYKSAEGWSDYADYIEGYDFEN